LTTPIWAYAGLFWGHVLAAFCLLYGAKGVMTLAEQPPAKGATRMALLAGLATGWAVVTEFPAAPAALLITMVAVWRLRPWSRWFRQLAAFAAAALAAALVLGVYNKVAFGSPFHLGYASVQGFDGMRSGLFGVTRPRTEALRGLLIGPRSLLYTSPLLVLGLLGHGISLARARQRWTAIFSLIVIVYGILLNASYIYWNGGWTYGPRHLTIVLPFLALGLPPLFDAIWRYVRPLAWVALVAGVFLTFIVVSTEGMTPKTFTGRCSNTTGPFSARAGWRWAGATPTAAGLRLISDWPWDCPRNVPCFRFWSDSWWQAQACSSACDSRPDGRAVSRWATRPRKTGPTLWQPHRRRNSTIPQ